MAPGASKRAKVSHSGTPGPSEPTFSGLHDKTGIIALPSELLLEIVSNFAEISVAEIRRNPPLLLDHYRQRFAALRALSQTCKELRSVCLPLAWERLEACTVAGPESVFFRDIGEHLWRKCNGLINSKHILPFVRCADWFLRLLASVLKMIQNRNRNPHSI